MEIKNSLLHNADPYRLDLDQTARSAQAALLQEKRGGAGEAASRAEGDRVSLSPAALLHTAAHAEAGKAPDIRREKVEALKARVESGAYVPDSRKIAEGLLKDEAFLAGALSRT
ncbi:MAG: flagellar biosynthesis anti-sigma factor FlgM [Desulfovibrio sp.]|nr:flagellar biosynthesis anti-sigma factor FlgM [Desulfovibrio sp.]